MLRDKVARNLISGATDLPPVSSPLFEQKIGSPDAKAESDSIKKAGDGVKSISKTDGGRILNYDEGDFLSDADTDKLYPKVKVETKFGGPGTSPVPSPHGPPSS